MRFLAGGPNIPDELLHECDKGNVVFLCGAGVSIPSGLPSFSELTQQVASKFDPDPASPVSLALKPWIEDDKNIPPAARVSFDQIFNLLYSRIPENRVNTYIREILDGCTAETWPHEIISTLSANSSDQAQIVTTNFDTLFEKCVSDVNRFEPPLLPNLGHRNTSPVGITYLHGRLVDSNDKQPNYVLSSSDFGRAYLAEGWATSYVRQLLKNYHVVMVGYSAEDPPVKYLLQGLDSRPSHENSKLYVFDAGTIEEVKDKWMGRGVTPIAYSWSRDHHHLWETLRSWSQRKKNPPVWRQSVISMAKANPKDLTPHERGKVLHLVRHPVGMKEFADAEVSPDPEWICVFDVRVRYGKRYEPYDYATESRPIDPFELYSIDTDQVITDIDPRKPRWPDSALDILAPQAFDGPMSESFRFSAGYFQDLMPVPGRFQNLAKWLSKNLSSQVILWWFARQRVLLPWVKSALKHELWRQSSELEEGMYKSWEILIDSFEGSEVSRPYDWFRLMANTRLLGWNALALKHLEQLLTPQYKLESLHGTLGVTPPVKKFDHDRLTLRLVTKLDVALPHFKSFDDIESIGDSDIESVLSIIGGRIHFFESLANYCDAYIDKSFSLEKGEDWDDDIKKLTRIYFDLLSRLSIIEPENVSHILNSVDIFSDELILRVSMKFWSNSDVFTGKVLSKILVDADSNWFWRSYYRSELFYMLRDRWNDLSNDLRRKLQEWLTEPRPNWHKQDDDVYNTVKYDRSVIAVRWLQKYGQVQFDSNFLNDIERFQNSIPEITDETIDEFIALSNRRPVMSSQDDSYDYFEGVNDRDLIEEIVSYVKREDTFDIQFKPFVGITKNDPLRALRALSLTEEPHGWMIVQFLSNVGMELDSVDVLNYLYSIPGSIVCEAKHSIMQYAEKAFEKSSNVARKEFLRFYSWFIETLSSNGSDEFKSSTSKRYESPRHGVEYATNSISGSIVSNLLVASSENFRFIDIALTIEKFFEIEDEARDHAVYVCCSNLGYLLERDPSWCKEKLLKYFNVDNASSPSAWFGLFAKNHPSWIEPVWSELKPDFLKIPKVILEWSPKKDWDAPFEWLIYSGVKGEGSGIEINDSESKIFISKLIDKDRSRLIFRFRQFFRGESNDSLVLDFIRNCWPFDRGEGRSKSSKAWVELLVDVDECRGELYSIVKEELHPIIEESFSFFEMYHTYNDHMPMTKSDPDIALDILSRVIPKSIRGHFLDEVRIVLSEIGKTQPELGKDRRYVRLLEIVSGAI